MPIDLGEALGGLVHVGGLVGQLLRPFLAHKCRILVLLGDFCADGSVIPEHILHIFHVAQLLIEGATVGRANVDVGKRLLVRGEFTL